MRIQKIYIYIYFFLIFFFLGGGGASGQGRCERRSEVFVKIQKKKVFWGGEGRVGGCQVWGGGGLGWM